MPSIHLKKSPCKSTWTKPWKVLAYLIHHESFGNDFLSSAIMSLFSLEGLTVFEQVSAPSCGATCFIKSAIIARANRISRNPTALRGFSLLGFFSAALGAAAFSPLSPDKPSSSRLRGGRLKAQSVRGRRGRSRRSKIARRRCCL